jgi:hypothetical protein
VAAADGTATATVTAEQWLGTRGTYCRDRCSIAAFSPDTGTIAVDRGYAMATGTLAVQPDTGLTDGQAVTVAGTDVMSSYAGPDVWIVHTGEWGLVQCDAGLVDDPTLFGVFANCGLPPGGPVDVPGSTFTRDVQVDRSTGSWAAPPTAPPPPPRGLRAGAGALRGRRVGDAAHRPAGVRPGLAGLTIGSGPCAGARSVRPQRRR